MKLLRSLKFSRLKRLSEVLNQKEKNILAVLGAVAFISGFFLAGQWIWTRSEVVAAAGGDYSEAVVGNPIYVNPVLAQTNDVDTDLSRLVFSGLLKFDKDQDLVNDLAEKYDVSEDQKTYTVTIRKDVLWHDNTPLDVDDVIFTIKTIQDPEYKSPLQLSLQGLTVEKVDEHTVRLILKKPFAPFPSLLTFGVMPEHLWSNVPPANFTLAELNLKPIGSGPWVFRSLTKDKQGTIRSYTLERHETFYGDKPLLERIIFKFYPTTEDALAAANNKEVLGISFVSQKVIDQLPKSMAPMQLNLSQYTAIFFNQKKNPFLKELEVRQALAIGANKAEILNQAADGEGRTIDGPILPGFIGYKADLAKYDFNLDQAKELLEKAGWKEMPAEEYIKLIQEQERKAREAAEAAARAANPPTPPAATPTPAPAAPTTDTPTETTPAEPPAEEEIVVDTDGQLIFRKKQDKILEITLTTVSYPENQKAAEMLEEWWQSIGVKVNLVVVDPAKIQKEVIKAREYDALLYGEVTGADPDPFPFWHSSQASDPGLNLSLFEDKEADRLLVEARQTADLQIREINYQKFQEILVKQLPAIFLYNPTYTFVLDRRIKGFDIEHINVAADRFNNLQDWYVRTKRIFKIY